MKNKARIYQVVLLVAGLAAWGVVARVLDRGGKLDFQPNVLHLKGSPYGRTLALAMRGPADVYWHRGEVHEHGGDDPDHSGCDHEQGECLHEDHEDHGDQAEPPPAAGGAEAELAAMVNRLEEEHAEHEEHENGDADEDAPAPEFSGVRPFLLDTIAGMCKAYHSRNNDRVETKLHRAYVMAETERRLALAFQMDPTNIACYGSYFMFLAEALARVEGGAGETQVIHGRRNAAAELAKYTYRYCLNFQDEAPAMITGAMAAHDHIQLVLSAAQPDLEEAARVLPLLDHCIGRYETLRAEMIGQGTWENFFIHRRNEMDQAYSLVRTLRNADHVVYERLKGASAAVPGALPQQGGATK